MTGDVRTDGTVDEHQRERDDHPIEPRTGPVRIIGAHRAGGPADEEAVEEEPAGGPPEAAGFGPEDWQTAEPALPHWTEAPTGEVPAVLSRSAPGDEEDPWAAVPEPSWREEHADWDRVDPLDAALRPGAGEGQSLQEADPSDREPWSFELGGGSQGDDIDGEDPFATWDEQAAASGADWGDDAGGAPAGVAGGVPAPRDVGAGGGFEGADDNEQWAPDDDAWDPDVVAGEKTTVMHLPDPPEEAGAEDDLPPPPVAHGGEFADVDEAELARHFARRAASERQVHPEDLAGEALGEDAYEDEALAADLEARRSRRPWGGRGDRSGRTATPELAPSLAVRAPPTGRPRRQPGSPQSRASGSIADGGRAGPAGRRDDNVASPRAGRNMPVAIASGVVIGALALVAFHFGTVPSMVVVTAVIGLAAVEAFAAFRRAGYHPATLLGLVAVVGLVIGSYVKTEEALPLVTVLLVAGTFAWHLVGVDNRAEPVRSTAATLLVYCWVGVFGSFAAMLLAPSYFPDRHGIAYLLGALIAAVAYDVGALAVGAWVGRRPLSAVSPGKTWEGVFGGAVAALVLSVGVVHLIHPWTLGHSVVLGVVVAIVSPIGDLSESVVKRRLGLKDMGRILPGHGGLLDRVDGLLFVLPATFYLVRAFHG